MGKACGIVLQIGHYGNWISLFLLFRYSHTLLLSILHTGTFFDGNGGDLPSMNLFGAIFDSRHASISKSS